MVLLEFDLRVPHHSVGELKLSLHLEQLNCSPSGWWLDPVLNLRHITACVRTRRLAHLRAHLQSLASRIRSSLLFPPAVGVALQDLLSPCCSCSASLCCRVLSALWRLVASAFHTRWSARCKSRPLADGLASAPCSLVFARLGTFPHGSTTTPCPGIRPGVPGIVSSGSRTVMRRREWQVR